jgi:hypothetical protein
MSSVGLIVAQLDLQLVQLLRGAMAPKVPPGGVGCPAGVRFNPRRVIDPTPRIEPRKVHEPEPRFEPRKVHEPEPRFVPPPPAPCEPWSCDAPRKSPCPIEPPWKKLPWHVPPPPPAIEVKQIRYQPDIPHKGSLIDFFI